jgi:uncharacterized repeat protein (TIGR01451 family)
MFSHNQRRVSALLLTVLLAMVSGMLVGQAFGQTFTGTPGTALTNAVINFSNLATNSPVSVPGTNLTSSPPAITFQAQDDGGTQDPPFPGGAAGPNHVVSMLDNSIRIQKRDGTVVSTIILQDFWAALGPYVDPRGAFDPKVLYDPFSGRWITTAVADHNQPTSSTLIGVSQTSDPTGNWNLYRIAADTNGEFWVNYPTFGFNTNWIAVSVTAFTIGNGPVQSQLYVFDKADLYAGGAGHYTEFTSEDESTFGVVEQPAATYDNTQTNLYLLAAINGDSGGNGEIQLLYVDGAVGSEVLHVGPQISVADPWDDHAPTFDFAPQLGSTNLIGLDDSRLSETVYRNGAIWVAHSIFLPAGGSATRSAIQWWQIGTDGTILQRGRIDDPTGNLFYGYPSIAVNQSNDVLIGYARFSASNFPSAYFSFRAGTDPTNTLQSEILLKAGEGPFTRSDRWGDHTSTVVDPVNDTDFWTIQEYSANTIKGTSLWGTWWGDVLVAPHVIASNAVVLSESCGPNNGVIDPFEHVSVQFSLLNTGAKDATNVVGTLLATGGVSSPSVAQNFGTIAAGGSASANVYSFLANAPCGSNILATLQLQSGAVDLGTASFRLPVGTPNGVFTQNFDSVTAPALPVDWSTAGSGVLSGWTTTSSVADTAPNAAFCPDTNDVGEATLVSPSIPITSPNAKLVFRNNYDLELGFDGGVLEIQIGGGIFQDILAAGGSFEQGGYSEFINTNAVNSSLIGLAAWSGNSGGWITTTVDLPAAAAGQNVQLRWRCVTDDSGGGNGWFIDGVEINDGGNCCTAGSEADLIISKLASPSPVLAGSNVTYTITVTNAGPGVAFSVTVTDTPPSSVVFLSATPSQGTCVTDVLGRVICNLQDMTNGTAATISVLVNAPSVGILTNIAQVGAFSPDPNPANNAALNLDSAVTSFSFVVTPASQDFGTILTGTTAQLSFVVTNGSGVSLNGTAVVGGAPFSIVSGTPFTVASLSSTNVVVRFTPVSAGGFTDKVVFATNIGNSTNPVMGAGATVPVANFSGTPTNGLVPFLVTFTDTSTGTITNRSWTFGDGGTTNTLNTTVTYTYNSAGLFTVSLAVSGPVGGVQSNTRINYILATNIPPQQVVSPGNRDFGVVPVGQSSTQTFSIVNAGLQTLTGSATAGAPFALVSGSPFTINGWQTGLVSVSFNPVAAGAFTGSVFFTSNGGASTNALTGTGAVAPGAGFTGTPTNGAAALLVSFTNTSTGTVTSTAWTFGDGGTSALASPSHSYTNAGTFSVSLTVLGPLGSNTLLRSGYITVTNAFVTPVAAFNATPTNGPAPLLVNFTDASTGTITNHSWTFGDGGTSILSNPSHTYTNRGVYPVTLTVTGPSGSSTTNRLSLITVTNALNTPPTVTIVRPGNGMLYPSSYTNQTITIVVNATSNDGASISKIEFFDGATEIGQATNNPGTNFLVHPALGTHQLSARADETFGTTGITSATTILIGAKNSPLGDWEITITGGDKGAQFLTFEDDFTANGFGIRLKTPALEDVTGTWSFTNRPKGQVTGPFLGQSDGTTNWTGVFKGPSNNSRTLSGSVPTPQFGTFHWRGVPPKMIPVLTGTWTGTVAIVRTTPAAVSFSLSPNANDPAVFDIAASTDTNTVVGELLVTSHNKVYAFVASGSNKEFELSGTFTMPRAMPTLTLRGADATGERVTIKIVQ